MSVWRSTGVYNFAVGDALRQRVGVDVASRFCASREVPVDEDLRRVVVAAGFQDVQLHVQTRIVRLPSPHDFVLGHLAATPVASDIRAMSHAARQALSGDVAQRLSAYQEGDGVAFPEEVNAVTANA